MINRKLAANSETSSSLYNEEMGNPLPSPFQLDNSDIETAAVKILKTSNRNFIKKRNTKSQLLYEFTNKCYVDLHTF